jgi:hypothetical protein
MYVHCPQGMQQKVQNKKTMIATAMNSYFIPLSLVIIAITTTGSSPGPGPFVLALSGNQSDKFQLGIGRGNPGVFKGYPDPDPPKSIPMLRVWV